MQVDLNKYFKLEQDKWIFTGEELIVHIPQRYEVYDLLSIDQSVHTLGVVGLKINGSISCGLNILALIEIGHGEVSTVTIDDLTYLEMKLVKDDIFIHKAKVVKNNFIPDTIFTEFISYGKWPYWVTYESAAHMLLNTDRDCGVAIDINRTTYEQIIAHLTRLKSDNSTCYRHTKMTEDIAYEILMLRDIGRATDSNTARLLGSYFDDGLNTGVLTDPKQDTYDIENIWRM